MAIGLPPWGPFFARFRNHFPKALKNYFNLGIRLRRLFEWKKKIRCFSIRDFVEFDPAVSGNGIGQDQGFHGGMVIESAKIWHEECVAIVRSQAGGYGTERFAVKSLSEYFRSLVFFAVWLSQPQDFGSIRIGCKLTRSFLRLQE
jgi:hypothetical protein